MRGPISWSKCLLVGLLLSEIVTTGATAALCYDGNPANDPPSCPEPVTLIQSAVLTTVGLWRGIYSTPPGHAGHLGPGW